MNDLQIFSNHDFGNIRALIKDGQPWLIGTDITKVLGYQNGSKAISDHVDDDDLTKCYPIIDNLGRSQQVTLVNESGLYSLVLSSKLPNAKKFKHWITSEVLPSIRKHGAYMTENTIEKALADPDFLIQLATNLKEEKGKRLEAEKKVKELQPAAEFGNAIGNCKDAVLVRDYAKVLANDDVRIGGKNVGQDNLFSWLHANGYIYRDKALNQYLPYKTYIDMGLFKVKETSFSTRDHGDKISYTLKITGKGQRYFYEKLII